MNPTGRDRDEGDEKRTSGRKRPYQPSDESTETVAKRPSQNASEEAGQSSSSGWSGNDPQALEASASFKEPATVSQSVSGSERRAQAPTFSLRMHGGNVPHPTVLVSDTSASSVDARSGLNGSLHPQALNPVGRNQGVPGLGQPQPPSLVANPLGQAYYAGTTSAELMNVYQLNLMQLMNQQQAAMNAGINPLMAQQALNAHFATNPYNRLLYQQQLSSMMNDVQRLRLAGILPETASAASLPSGGATTSLASIQGVTPRVYKPPVNPTEGPLLYMPSDDDILSDQQCLLRKQIELFAADEEDISAITPGRRKEIMLGQVGIRCKYCTHIPIHNRTKGAVYYPAKLKGIYQAAQNMAFSHFCDSCEHIDPFLKAELQAFQQAKSSSGHGGKQYWADSAKVLGVIESEDDGLRFDPSRKHYKKIGRVERG